jgi:hypothetical protein
VASLAYDAPAEVRLKVHQAVRERLAKLDPLPTQDVTKQLVDAEVAKEINRWRTRRELEEILTECANSRLPYSARGTGSELSPWQLRAQKAALDAINNAQLRIGITMDEVRRIVYRAVEPIKQEFEDQQWRKQMVSSVAAYLGWDAKPDEREAATAAVSKAIAEVPVGSSQAAMVEARDRALTPFKATIADRDRRRWREFGELLRRAR